jgi:parvulin-like peptidyl-prolyl isomerase
MLRLLENKNALALTLFLAVFIWGCGAEEKAPDPDVVAIFDGGRITRGQVQTYLDNALKSQNADPVKLRKLIDSEAIATIARQMILDQKIRQTIEERKLDTKDGIKHVMKHISEELNIDKLHAGTHEGKIRVSDEDIRRYYEDNRNVFGEKSLSESAAEVRTLLQGEKEKEYFENYLEGLRRNALVTRDDRLLEYPQPTEEDAKIAYDEKLACATCAEKSTYLQQGFDALKEELLSQLLADNQKRWFEKNRNMTLFTVHGKRFTAGEFYQELEELPPQERDKYRDPEALKGLMDRLIDRLLVVEDTYDQAFNSENDEDFKHIREDILRQLLHQEDVDEKLQVTDDEVKSFYEQRKDAFVSSPRVQINYIRVGRGDTEDERKRAQTKIESAYGRLKPGFMQKGEAFEAVAREYSEDPETAQNGGRLDRWFSESGNLIGEITTHEFHDRILGLSIGDISKPFNFHGSYYVVQVREREEPRPLAFDEVKEQIMAELRAKKHDENTVQMEQALLKEANIKIFDSTIKSMLKAN